jgi:hypothetical protein
MLDTCVTIAHILHLYMYVFAVVKWHLALQEYYCLPLLVDAIVAMKLFMKQKMN